MRRYVQTTANDQPWKANRTFSFNIDLEDDVSLVPGTFYLTGDLSIKTTAGVSLASNKDVSYNTVIGAHGLFGNVLTTVNGSMFENLTQYPRAMMSKTVALQNTDSLIGNASKVECLQYGQDTLVRNLMSRSSVADVGSTIQDTQGFACPLNFCYNNVINGDLLNVRQTTITCQTVSQTEFLYGADAASYEFSLNNLEMHYQVTETDGVNNSKLLKLKESRAGIRSYQEVTNTFNSNNAVMYGNLSGLILGISFSFCPNASITSATLNSTLMTELDTLTRLIFALNNQTGDIIHELRFTPEIIMNYRRSWGASVTNDKTLAIPDYLSQGYFGAGVDFGTTLPVQGRFSMNVQSSTTVDTTMYAFVHTVLTL